MPMFFKIVLLLMFAFPVFLVAQTEKDLLDKLSQTTEDSVKADIYIDLHNVVFKTELDKAELYAKEVIRYGKSSGVTRLEMIGYRGIARCARKARDYPKVLHYDSLALNLAKTSNNIAGEIMVHIDCATDYLDNEQPAKALKHLKEAESLSASGGNLSSSAKIQNRLGWYYASQYQHSLAVASFKRALALYEEAKDERMIAETRYPYAKSLIALGQTAQAPELLFSAIEYYRAKNLITSLAGCLTILGQSYFINGDYEKALSNFNESKSLYQTHENNTSVAMVTTDIATTHLTLGDTLKARQYGNEASAVLESASYVPALPALYIFWGRFYLHNGDFKNADAFLTKAATIARENGLQDQLNETRKWLGVLNRKQNKNVVADSLEMEYVNHVVKEREQAVVVAELKQYISRNRIKDTNAIKLLSLVYSPGGAEKLNKELKGRSLSEIISMDSLYASNYTLLSQSSDSSLATEYNKQLLDMETAYRTRLISDSLMIEKQHTLMARSEAKSRNVVIGFTVTLSALLAIGFWMQTKSRKKAEKDRQYIKLLQDEIHHRVNNNLGVVVRMVNIAEKTSPDENLTTLKHRIKSISILHKHLYSEDASIGKISLQKYITHLCSAIGDTFDKSDAVTLTVDAAGELQQQKAEKLGLVINELVTNAFKYAFAGRKQGHISVRVHPVKEKLWLLQVSDDGIGSASMGRKGYGMKLIRGLTHELGGSGQFEHSNGTSYTMTFPVS